jgi:hypothetical protein
LNKDKQYMATRIAFDGEDARQQQIIVAAVLSWCWPDTPTL